MHALDDISLKPLVSLDIDRVSMVLLNSPVTLSLISAEWGSFGDASEVVVGFEQDDHLTALVDSPGVPTCLELTGNSPCVLCSALLYCL